MIVVDSSVWIGHLRNEPTEPVERLRSLVESDTLLVGDIILLEVLQGARGEAEARRIEYALRQFPIARMLDEELAVLGAAHYRTLRRAGLTVRKTIDVVIATFCIAGRHTLLHDDRDFTAFADHLALRTL